MLRSLIFLVIHSKFPKLIFKTLNKSSFRFCHKGQILCIATTKLNFTRLATKKVRTVRTVHYTSNSTIQNSLLQRELIKPTGLLTLLGELCIKIMLSARLYVQVNGQIEILWQSALIFWYVELNRGQKPLQQRPLARVTNKIKIVIL